jgi:hypothetical protein
MEFSDARGRMKDDFRPTVPVVGEPRWILRTTPTTAKKVEQHNLVVEGWVGSIQAKALEIQVCVQGLLILGTDILGWAGVAME